MRAMSAEEVVGLDYAAGEWAEAVVGGVGLGVHDGGEEPLLELVIR